MNGTVQLSILNVIDSLDEALNTGDPTLKEWFLVKSNFWPVFLCFLYFIIVNKIGPAFMKDRKPFDLRIPMMVYNLTLVVAYAICITITINLIRETESVVLCRDTVITKQNTTYMLATCGWVVYLLKYVEFLDTIFFVLRKKDNLITNLHVIHHAVLPICGWVLFRAEKSGFQAYPVLINSIVHTFMYSYYGLAAMGPSVRKYLWWKRYLTMMQMVQFILILVFVGIIMPAMGCTSAKASILVNVLCAVVFFALFYNFYQHTFKSKVKPSAAEPVKPSAAEPVKPLKQKSN